MSTQIPLEHRGEEEQQQPQLPWLPKLALDILTPKEIAQEFIGDFEELYRTWAVPKYGSWAPLWAWGQVVRTFRMLIRETTLEFLERRRAR
jgi:hypothetical protein